MIFVRFFGWVFSIAALLFLVAAGGVAVYIHSLSSDLPDTNQLRNYQPPVVTRVHAADGELASEYAHERRLFLPIQMIPDRVKQAFISAEDKGFYTHPGIDLVSLAGAAIKNIDTIVSGSNKRMVGASTITQQVAKVFLLTNERTIDRKIREAMLTLKIEQTYTKDQILELYLNEIYLGFRSYGVAAASLAFFDKPLSDLKLEEVAYLAALPKAPENYNPYRSRQAAVERRNYVVQQMVENGYATREEGDAAMKAAVTIDACLTRLEKAVKDAGGVMLVTADHGNAEMMRDPTTHEPHTAHTTGPVDLVLVNPPAGISAIADGRLADVAPTLLALLGLAQPADMTGKSLVGAAAADLRAAG